MKAFLFSFPQNECTNPLKKQKFVSSVSNSCRLDFRCCLWKTVATAAATPTYCKEIYWCRFPTVIPLESLQSIIKNLQIDTSPWLTFIWKMSFILNISRFNSLMRYRDMDRNKSCLAQKKNYYRRKISPAQIFFSWLTAWLDEARWIVSFTLPGRDFWEGL